MAVKDAREYLKATAPTAELFIGGIGSFLFLIAIPASFVIGAIWGGIVIGFKMGRDW